MTELQGWAFFGVGVVVYLVLGFGLALLMMAFAKWVNR